MADNPEDQRQARHARQAQEEQEAQALAQSKLQGITPAQLSLWRHHPVTVLLLNFLSDYLAQLRQTALDRLESGTLDDSFRDEVKGRIQAVAEMIDLKHEDIALFYGASGAEAEE